MNGPISFIYGNCVFARGLDDCWAAFSLGTSSYEWLSSAAKMRRLHALVEALEGVEADLQIIRASAPWDARAYGREQVEELEAGVGGKCEQRRPAAISKPRSNGWTDRWGCADPRSSYS